MKAWLKPGRIRAAFRNLRSVREKGGPRRVRLERLGRPEGWIFPTSEASIAIETRSGEHVRVTPELPVPWPYAWGYRIARRLNLPLAGSVDPEDVRVSLPIPEFIARRLTRATDAP